MTTPAFLVSAAPVSSRHQRLAQERAKRLYDDLAFALGRTQASTLRAWGLRSARRLISLAGKRISALASLAARVGRAGVAELSGLLNAWRAERFGEQVGDRTAAGIDGSIALVRGARDLVSGIGGALAENPRENAPKVLAAFLGFYAGSGGVDGDGGIPDLDLLAGIDAHRSLLTHSILAGVAAEGVLLAVADLAGEIHAQLPFHHDPLWDRLAEVGGSLTSNLATGASAGIAYHLLWDAGIEPAPYHGLPFEMSMEAHQSVMGANGLAEGAYVAGQVHNQHNQQPILLTQGPPAKPSRGRKVVNSIAQTGEKLARSGRGWLNKFGKRGD